MGRLWRVRLRGSKGRPGCWKPGRWGGLPVRAPFPLPCSGGHHAPNTKPVLPPRENRPGVSGTAFRAEGRIRGRGGRSVCPWNGFTRKDLRSKDIWIEAALPLPVRIRQHRMKRRVRQRPALDRDPQTSHVRSVHRQYCARRVIMGEKHLLLRPLSQPPLPHPALEGPQQPGVELRPTALRQMLKDRRGLQFQSLAQHPSACPQTASSGSGRFPRGRHLALFHNLVLPQILARRVAGHPRLHGIHADGSSLVALEKGQL